MPEEIAKVGSLQITASLKEARQFFDKLYEADRKAHPDFHRK